MSWTLPKHSVETFERNMLASVVTQLRFQPILKISEKIADFQDRVRPRFPGYESVDSSEIEISASGIVNVRDERAHKFPASNNKAVLSVGTSSFAVEYSDHKDRADILSDVKMILGALQHVYAPVIPVRLGLRYVNLIQRKRVSEDLRRAVAWTDLLAKEFTSVPGAVASFDDSTNFMVEVSSPCTRGKMTVRYGIPAASLASRGVLSELHFRVDTDRFIDTSFDINEVVELLEIFSVDTFQVFMAAAGPALLEWMAQQEFKGG